MVQQADAAVPLAFGPPRAIRRPRLRIAAAEADDLPPTRPRPLQPDMPSACRHGASEMHDDEGGAQVQGPAPTLGEHTVETLARIGFSADEIRELAAGGATAPQPKSRL